MGDGKVNLPRLLMIAAIVAGGFALMDTFGGDHPSAADATADAGAAGADAGVDAGAAAAGSSEASAQATPEPAARLSEQVLAARQASQHTFHIRTEAMDVTLTDLTAGVTSVKLKRTQFQDDEGRPMELVSTDQEQYTPFRPTIRGAHIPADATWRGEQLSDTAVRFTWRGDGFEVAQRVEAGRADYELWSTTRVTNLSDGTRPVRLELSANHYVRRSDESGGFIGRPSTAASHTVCATREDGVKRFDRKKLEHPMGFGPDVELVAIENTYFAFAMTPDGAPAERCRVQGEDRFAGGSEADGTLFEARLIYPRDELAPHESSLHRTALYVGPKDLRSLTTAGHGLTRLVDMGWFTFIGKYLTSLLRFIHSGVGNWGIAIILLTLLVKLVLLPLTHKSFQSMARMRLVKPQMDHINELYADDREKKGAAMMELYRKEKINPLGGCLPSLLQMPIWFALYRSISTNIELYHAPFTLWWTDLSAPDPIYVLPLMLGGLMFLQQKLTPSTMDAAQAKMMMYFMPLMITVFMLFLPAGLCLYMVTNSALGIGQQRYIQHKLEQASPAAAEAEAKTADTDERAPTPKRTKTRKRRGRA
ncbi:MAG: membrane protein insertase YidC [Deltaproteobacteria bacterium]|nr:membrane protein insertase YidC [Deltaproteobacteria bacterium]